MGIVSVLNRYILAAVICAMAGTASGQSLQKVTIGLSSASLPAAGARIAKAMGLFEKHGIDAVITAMDSGSVATMALIAGSINFETSGGTDVVVARARDQDMVAICSIYSGISAVLILAKPVADRTGVSPGAPVSERLKALDGMVIASPSATSTFTLALKPSVEAVGAKVSFTYMAQPAMLAALQTGAIKGLLASSPYYAAPLLNGTGVMWLNGPKGEFPPEFTPANAVTLNAMRAYAAANPDLMRRAAAVFSDLSQAVKDRPAEVKAAISRLYPDIDAHTLDLLYESESAGFRAKPLTAADMAREIAFLKTSGVPVPQIDSLNPAAMMSP